MKFVSPLSLMVSSRKKFILNLNQYRNTHYRVLNYAKALYKDWMSKQIKKANKCERILCIYKVYQSSNRHYDVGNVCCIHEKFFEDAFVELGKLPDDNREYIPLVIYMKGGVDKENPRVDIEVLDFNIENLRKVFRMIEELI